MITWSAAAVYLLLMVWAGYAQGPVAVMAMVLVAGVALVVLGIRATGWARWALIVLGILAVGVPIFIVVDAFTGHFETRVVG